MDKIIFVLSQTQQSFESFRALLKADGWRVEFINPTNLDTILSVVGQEKLTTTCIAILDHPEGLKITRRESSVILEFHRRGGSLLVASSGRFDEDGALNYLVSSFGVQLNRDCIIRPNLYRHFHPKEAMLENFIVNRGLADSMRKYATDSSTTTRARIEDLLRVAETGPASAGDRDDYLRIIYPSGCSLSVNKKESTIMMTSSRWAIPSGRAICAFHAPNKTPEGRAVILGSAALMSDKFLDEENNRALVCAIMDFIGNDKDFQINSSDARTASTTDDKNMGPAIDKLVDLPVACIQESEPLPANIDSLIDRRLFTIDGKMIPSIFRAYRDLNVEPGFLGPIKPHLNPSIGLSLEPATHGFFLSRSATDNTDKQQSA